jgi:putative PIN family toxin of toxin-antitoxin system
MVGRFVLDTNIVLDWLVFRDPGVAGLQQALSDRRVELITHQPALDELRRVLGYQQCKLQPDEQQQIFERYLSAAASAATPEGFSLENLLLPAGFPLCRDHDDQHFLALAYHAHADGLITKDKALLRLRKHAGKFGVTILGPGATLRTLRSTEE